MIIIGDAETAATVLMWAQVIDLLQEGGNIGKELPLKCSRHPNTDIMVSEPDHSLMFAPEAGCTLPCEKRLQCGHGCPGRCHSDVVHGAVKCLEPCQRLKSSCEHDCPLVCNDPCEDRCKKMLSNLDITLPCGHLISEAACWQARDPTAIKCGTRVKKTIPGCGHQVEVECCTDVTQKSWSCPASCGVVLPCGHTCKIKCAYCREVLSGMVIKQDHGQCRQICGRNFTTCQHSCLDACHSGDCKPCRAPCDVQCSHLRCSRPCNEPCTPCAEATCGSKCPHGSCTLPCAAPCNWIPCSKRCKELLECGHQYPSFCGEACPDTGFCQKCADKDIKGETVDMILMETYQNIDLDESPCIFRTAVTFSQAKLWMDRWRCLIITTMPPTALLHLSKHH